MIPVNDIHIGDRVRFNNPICMGHGELGTITKIEYKVLNDLRYPIVWVRGDCHGQETGRCCFDNILSEWIPADNTGLNKWLGV